MDIKDFFALVLPVAGQKILVTIDGPDAKWRHFAYTDISALAVAAQVADQQGKTVYHACASFHNKSRKSDNAVAARAFWLDVDCGPSKPYATQREGLQALLVMCRDIALPAPLIVSSGVGLHVYWPLDVDAPSAAWVEVAALFKRVVVHQGLQADPSRTADISSVLRPVGTTHRKNGDKPVAVLRGAYPMKLEDFYAALVAYAEKHGVPATDDIAKGTGDCSINNDLLGGMEPPASDAEKVADACAVVGRFRDTLGCVPEPMWYRSLSVVSHCVDGAKKVHEWSSGHPTYSHAETDTKLLQASKFGPARCDTIKGTCSEASALCAACPHAGRIASPISLGYGTASGAGLAAVGSRGSCNNVPPGSPLPTHVQASTAAGGGVGGGQGLPPAPIAPPVPVPMPNTNYRWNPHTKTLDRFNPKKLPDGGLSKDWLQIADIMFYASEMVQYPQTGEQVLVVEAWSALGTRKVVNVPGSLIGDGTGLKSLLGAHAITPLANMDSEIRSYLQRWLSSKRDAVASSNLYSNMGWHGRDFVIGSELYSANTPPKTISLAPKIADMARYFEPRGSLAEWVRIVDTGYNVPGLESFQFMILSGFAAPLLDMFGNYGGVTVYAHSEGSGFGKSTAEHVAAAAWYDWRKLQVTDKATTTNAIYAMLGLLHNMPMIFDELTNKSNAEVSELVYLISSGDAKKRCDQKGGIVISEQEWKTIVLASGNTRLSEKLGQHRANSEAEVARLFEFTVDARPTMSQVDAMKLFAPLSDHTGQAGRRFIQHVVDNYDATAAALFTYQEQLQTTYKLTQKERFWSVLLSAVITSLEICQTEGLLSFDTMRFMSWVGKTLSENRSTMVEAVTTPDDLFGEMVGALWPGVLVTLGPGNAYKGIDALILSEPRGPVIGRAIVPEPGAAGANQQPELYLVDSAVKAWCSKRGVSASEVFKGAVANGLVLPQKARYRLGGGCSKYASLSSPVACWRASVAGAKGIVPSNTAPGPLTVVQGGRAKP